jgi:hypothetical protein
VPAASSSQRPSIARPLAGCPLAAPPQAATPPYRSGLRPARVAAPPICSPAFQPWGASRASPAPGLRCPLLTSAGRSGRIPPPAVRDADTPQISRGQRSSRRCIDAGCIQHAPAVDGGLGGCVPTRPERTTPRLRFVSLAPHLRSTLPSDAPSRERPGASRVLRLHAHLDRGLAPPSMTACTAHTPTLTGAIKRPVQRLVSLPALSDLILELLFILCLFVSQFGLHQGANSV